jgi:hypothetical protein
MRHRVVHWLVLGFAALWFNVVLPVHKRGQITLGGGGTPGSASHACCRTGQETAPGSDKGHCPASDSRPSGPCAVCFYMAGLCTPPPVIAVEQRLGYAGPTRVVAPYTPNRARLILRLNSRAPPLA